MINTLPKGLLDAVRNVISEQIDKQKKYQEFFDSVLKKFDVKSPSELDDAKKKEFFTYIEKNWKGEKTEETKPDDDEESTIPETDDEESKVNEAAEVRTGVEVISNGYEFIWMLNQGDEVYGMLRDPKGKVLAKTAGYYRTKDPKKAANLALQAAGIDISEATIAEASDDIVVARTGVIEFDKNYRFVWMKNKTGEIYGSVLDNKNKPVKDVSGWYRTDDPEDALKKIKYSMVRRGMIDEAAALHQGDSQQYKWSDINTAMMQAGKGAKHIVQLLSALKGKGVSGTGNNQTFLWADINIALTDMFVGVRTIAYIASKLQGKDIHESLKALDEAKEYDWDLVLYAFNNASLSGNELRKVTTSLKKMGKNQAVTIPEIEKALEGIGASDKIVASVKKDVTTYKESHEVFAIGAMDLTLNEAANVELPEVASRIAEEEAKYQKVIELYCPEAGRHPAGPEALEEGWLRNEYDREYFAMIEDFKKLPWAKKVKEQQSSAITEYYAAKENGDEYALTMHRPSTKWGDNWNFLGLYITPAGTYRPDLKFDKTGSAILRLPWNGNKQNIPQEMQLANLKELETAIKYVKSLKEDTAPDPSC